MNRGTGAHLDLESLVSLGGLLGEAPRCGGGRAAEAGHSPHLLQGKRAHCPHLCLPSKVTFSFRSVASVVGKGTGKTKSGAMEGPPSLTPPRGNPAPPRPAPPHPVVPCRAAPRYASVLAHRTYARRARFILRGSHPTTLPYPARSPIPAPPLHSRASCTRPTTRSATNGCEKTGAPRP